jgi:hypothetical protein
MACDPATLLQQSTCFQCINSGLLFAAVEIVILCAIRDGETVPTDPQALISQANCILACIPPGAMSAVKLAILCDIMT